jgi:hypothetical protein
MRTATFVLVTSLLTVGLNGLAPAGSPQSPSHSDERIWAEFVGLMKSGELAERNLRPAYTTPSIMRQFLERMRAGASWPEWERKPEVYRVGSLVHFLVKLSEKGVPGTYSFTFVTENGHWYLQHFESIAIRLDRVGAPPVSTFPDLSEGKKAWMRQETYWSQMVGLFLRMRAAAGPQPAFDMFRDGQGYFVQAKTWVPFVPPARAFVLYLCWEQSRLQGNDVTLSRLTDEDAVVAIDSICFRLYRQTSHLRQQVSEDEYRRIFETVWRDRAVAAGWNVQFTYDGTRCSLRFTRTT